MITTKKIRIKLTTRSTAILAAALLLCGCVHDDPIPPSTGVRDCGHEVEIPIEVRLSDASTLTTRALSQLNESTITGIRVLVFAVDGANETFAYQTTASDVTLTGASVRFGVRLRKSTAGEEYRLVLIANSPMSVNIAAGTGKADALAALTFTPPTEWTSGTNYLPMWGEMSTTAAVSATMNVSAFGTASLIRSLARVNVINTDPKFSLSMVKVYNSLGRARVVPLAANFVDGKAIAPSIPASAPIVGSFAAAINGGVVERAIYTAEHQAAAALGDSDAQYIIIGGKYDPSDQFRYYRIDLATDKVPLPVLRNHTYNISIVNLGGASGYVNEDDARTNTPVNGVGATVTAWDDGLDEEVTSDGIYTLAVTTSLVDVHYQAGDVEVEFSTDWTGAVTVVSESDWLTVSGNTSPLTATFTENAGDIPRTGKIAVTAGRLTKKINITQSISPAIVVDNPPDGLLPYVGAFWRASQTGERLINIPWVEGAEGPWSVNVAYYGDNWGSDQIVFSTDPTIDTGVTYDATTESPADMNDADSDARYNITGGTTSASGTLTAAAGNYIRFRMGITDAYTPTAAAPARYAVVLLTYNDGQRRQKIYIRQGEGDDYVMRPTDPMTGSVTSDTRPYARRWSPYNLTDPQHGEGGAAVANHTAIGVNGGAFTDYPSQCGYIFQWAVSAVSNLRAYHPTNPGAGTSIANYPVYATGATRWPTQAFRSESCPEGYARPSDGNIRANWTGDVSTSEYRQSLFFAPVSGDGVTQTAYYAVGCYADGFYDRRCISNINTVSDGGEMACYGYLHYNPASYASLFTPSAYQRGDDSRMYGVGRIYWTSSSQDRGVLRVDCKFINLRSYRGFSIRCVKGDDPILSTGAVVARHDALSTGHPDSGGSATMTWAVATAVGTGCDAYWEGSQTDAATGAGRWRVPTQVEMSEISTSMYAIDSDRYAMLSSFASSSYYYWSTSEVSAANAYRVLISSGAKASVAKTSSQHVRCVR